MYDSKPRGTELEVDLERGSAMSKEDAAKDPILGNTEKKKSLKRVFGGVLRFDGKEDDYSSESCSTSSGCTDELEVLVDRSSRDNASKEERTGLSKYGKGKSQKTSSRKPSKPPRPPKGPSLDAADRKLVQDIAENAMRKRARNERMKALKKARAANGSSSSSSGSTVTAMLITVIFFVIIIFQGIRIRSTAASQDSPANVTREGLVSIHHYHNFSTNAINTGSSSSPWTKKKLDLLHEMLYGFPALDE